jgi:parvulin-like peptidyl-prolyl isomerase
MLTVGLPVPLATVLLAAVLPAQPDYELVATFTVDGKEQELSRRSVALELARTNWVRDAGADALNHLIDLTLVRQAAKQQGLMPSREEVKGQVRVIEASLLEQKRSLDMMLRTRRITRADFEEQLAIGIAKQRLVLKALGESKPRNPTPTELQLWSKEARKKAKVILDHAALPAGVLAKVNDAEISSMDLGAVLFMKAAAKTLDRAVKDLVFRAIIAQLARQKNVRITEQDLDADVRRRRLRHERRKTKVPFANILKATTGLTVEQYKRDPHLRAQVLYRKLVGQRYPPSTLMDLYLADKRNVLKRHGARRKMSVLLVRAADRPNRLVKLDRKAAKKRIEELRAEIQEKSFADVARINSEGPNKKSGGAIGWQHQQDREAPVPREVLAAAFAAEVGKVTAPVQTRDGFWLVFVTGLEPEPKEDVILRRLRGELSDEYLKQLYKAADVKLKVR